MSRIRVFRALLFASLVGYPVVATAQAPAAGMDRFVGKWEGTLDAGIAKLRLALSVERDSAGGVRGSMISIDQGNAQMPSTMSVHGDTLLVALPAARASYTGVVTAGRDTLRGTFTQGGSLALDLHRVQTIGVLVRPQEPKPPFPYAAKEVAVESVAGVRLSCTMLTPQGAGPFPAVVFVTGSGAQDRDEALMGHRPFLVIADNLARRGVASLRCDDRGFGKSTGDFAAATSGDFANDAEAEVHFLRGEPSVVRNRVGMIGHSEGGMIAPLVAARSSDVAFIVLMAGPGIPGDSILFLQQRLIAAAAGAPPAQIEFGARLNHVAFAAIKAGGDSAAIVARIRDGAREAIATLPADDRPPLDAVMRQMSQALTPWFRYFLSYDPRPTLQRVRVPVLALNGTLDLQVPYKEDLGAIEAALKAGGNRDYQVVALPSLNHLFQTAKTGAVSEYGENTETISPAALDAMSSWILKHAVVP